MKSNVHFKNKLFFGTRFIIRILISVFVCLKIISDLRAQNTVSTLAGGIAGYQDTIATQALFRKPFGMCAGTQQDLYICDSENHVIRKIDLLTQLVSTFAGNGIAGFKDGSSDSAQFNSPVGICMDNSGNFYVSDFNNHRIRKISTTGQVSTIAGKGLPGYAEGVADSALFNFPRGITVDGSGNIYVADSWNHRIRRITPAGLVSAFAGGGSNIGVGSVGSWLDGQDTIARFYTPSGLNSDISGNIYVADAYNHRIRKIDGNGLVSTVAGTGISGPGNGGFAEGDILNQRLNTPTEVLTNAQNDKIYIGDTFNQRVRCLDLLSGNLSTIAGSSTAGFVNGADTFARFDYPRGLAMFNSIIYVCDFNNHAVRQINLSGNKSGEIKNNDDFLIWPVPFHDILNFNKPVRKAQIYDVNAKLVFEIQSEILFFNLETKGLKCGIYHLNLEMDNDTKINVNVCK